MQEFKYKGIDLQKIKEVQEVHNDVLPTPYRIEHIDIEQMVRNICENNHVDSINREIEKYAEKVAEDFDFVIICEMAKRFLEQEIEKIKTQPPKKVKLDLFKKFKGIWNVKKESEADG